MHQNMEYATPSAPTLVASVPRHMQGIQTKKDCIYRRQQEESEVSHNAMMENCLYQGGCEGTRYHENLHVEHNQGHESNQTGNGSNDNAVVLAERLYLEAEQRLQKFQHLVSSKLESVQNLNPEQHHSKLVSYNYSTQQLVKEGKHHLLNNELTPKDSQVQDPVVLSSNTSVLNTLCEMLRCRATYQEIRRELLQNTNERISRNITNLKHELPMSDDKEALVARHIERDLLVAAIGFSESTFYSELGPSGNNFVRNLDCSFVDERISLNLCVDADEEESKEQDDDDDLVKTTAHKTATKEARHQSDTMSDVVKELYTSSNMTKNLEQNRSSTANDGNSVSSTQCSATSFPSFGIYLLEVAESLKAARQNSNSMSYLLSAEDSSRDGKEQHKTSETRVGSTGIPTDRISSRGAEMLNSTQCCEHAGIAHDVVFQVPDVEVRQSIEQECNRKVSLCAEMICDNCAGNNEHDELTFAMLVQRVDSMAFNEERKGMMQQHSDLGFKQVTDQILEQAIKPRPSRVSRAIVAARLLLSTQEIQAMRNGWLVTKLNRVGSKKQFRLQVAAGLPDYLCLKREASSKTKLVPLSCILRVIPRECQKHRSFGSKIENVFQSATNIRRRVAKSKLLKTRSHSKGEPTRQSKRRGSTSIGIHRLRKAQSAPSRSTRNTHFPKYEPPEGETTGSTDACSLYVECLLLGKKIKRFLVESKLVQEEIVRVLSKAILEKNQEVIHGDICS